MVSWGLYRLLQPVFMSLKHYTELLNLLFGWSYSSIVSVMDSCVLGDGSRKVVSSCPGEDTWKIIITLIAFFHIWVCLIVQTGKALHQRKRAKYCVRANRSSVVSEQTGQVLCQGKRITSCIIAKCLLNKLYLINMVWNHFIKGLVLHMHFVAYMWTCPIILSCYVGKLEITHPFYREIGASCSLMQALIKSVNDVL